MFRSRLLFLLLVFVTFSCSTPNRHPASLKLNGNDSLESLYLSQIEIENEIQALNRQALADRNRNFSTQRQLLEQKRLELQTRIRLAGDELTKSENGTLRPQALILKDPDREHGGETMISIESLDRFSLVDNFLSKKFYFRPHEKDGSSWIQVQLGDRPLEGLSPGSSLDGQITCDAPFQIKRATQTLSYPGPSQVSVKINAASAVSVPLRIRVSPDAGECRLFFKAPHAPQSVFGFRLVNEQKEFKLHRSRSKIFQTCLLPQAEASGPVEKFFLTSRYLSMTCPQALEGMTTLEEPQQGVKAKIEALTGSPLPDSVFAKQDPYTPLDFSKAPPLDEILISYLVFRADFYGALMMRALEYHAQRGALIRIMASDVIQLDKDRALLQKYTDLYPNIQIQYYKWKAPVGAGFKDLVSTFHKTMHVKMFVTLSSQSPDANQVVIGGRNIHDGFVFKSASELSAFPELNQYGSGKGKDESFVHWRDFEVLIKDKAFAELSAAHYDRVWRRDPQTQTVESININIPVRQSVDPTYFQNSQPLVRHFVSVPYQDERSLERFFSELIDSAQSTLDISTPYFRPTKRLSEAFARAVKRGVKVRLITRLNLKGDTADFILEDVNKAGVNAFRENMRIYEYTEPDVILHSKIVLVDGKMALLGSVNLNQRSFIHDLENALLVYSPEFHQRMAKILEVYRQHSRPITDQQRIKGINRLILGIPVVREAL